MKILEGLVPNCGLEESAENERLGRLCQVRKLMGPNNVQKLRSQSVQCTGPSLFNSLPKKLRNLKRVWIDEFKEHLDNYLTDIPDQPKVPGMTAACMTNSAVPTNSLLHWIPLVSREAVWRTGRKPGA